MKKLISLLLCLLLPLMDGIPFWTEVFKGLMLGVTLALVLPLCGATKKREPFAGLMWIPLMMLCIVVAGQYMAAIGIYGFTRK